MPPGLLEILIVLSLTIINGVFAMSEASLVAARKARLQQRANEGNKGARAALELLASPNSFLSTVQIGITLVGIVLGAFSGATLAELLAPTLARIEFLAPSAEAVAFALVVLATTYLSLIIGELVPKQLALNNPENVAARVAGPMLRLSQLASPLVRFLGASTNLLLRLLGVRPSNEPAVTEEEIRVMIEQGTQAGTFERAESDLVGGVFRLDDIRVGAIMTPRPDVIWLDVTDTPAEILDKVRASGHSRFPLVDGSLDNVVGIVSAKDLLARVLAGQPCDPRTCQQTPVFVPESLSALKMLETFKNSNTHIALVIDEYGGWQGIVTVTDVFEAIIGSGYLGEGEPDAVRRDDGSWLLDGLMTTDEVENVLQAIAFPDDSEREYETLGGFIMHRIGRIPTTSDVVEFQGWRFEVMDMDGHRVDKVLALIAPPAEPPAPPAPDGG